MVICNGAVIDHIGLSSVLQNVCLTLLKCQYLFTNYKAYIMANDVEQCFSSKYNSRNSRSFVTSARCSQLRKQYMSIR